MNDQEESEEEGFAFDDEEEEVGEEISTEGEEEGGTGAWCMVLARRRSGCKEGIWLGFMSTRQL